MHLLVLCDVITSSDISSVFVVIVYELSREFPLFIKQKLPEQVYGTLTCSKRIVFFPSNLHLTKGYIPAGKTHGLSTASLN